MVSDDYVKGMSKDEIYEKIDILKTDEAKINYLKSLESKTGLMKEGTKKAFFEIIGEKYEGKDEYYDAKKYYEKSDSKEALISFGDKLLAKRREKPYHGYSDRDLGIAVECYEKANYVEGLEKIGQEEFEHKHFKKAADIYEKANNEKKAKESWIKVAENYADKAKKKDTSFRKELREAQELFFDSAKIYEKINMLDKAKEIWTKLAEFNLKKLHPCFSDMEFESYKKAFGEKKAKEMLISRGDFRLRDWNRHNRSYDIEAAEEYYEKAGMSKKEIGLHLGDKLEGKFGAKYYEQAGDMEKAKKRWIEEGDHNSSFAAYSPEFREKSLGEAKEAYFKGGLNLTESNEHIGDQFLKRGMRNRAETPYLIEEAAKFYEKAGNEKKANEAFEMAADAYLDCERWNLDIEAMELYEKAGKIEKAKELGIKIADNLLKRNTRYGIDEEQGDKVVEIYEKMGVDKSQSMKIIGDSQLEQNHPDVALKYYEKANLDKSDNISDLELLAKIYDKQGNGSKSMKIHKRIKKLNKNGK